MKGSTATLIFVVVFMGMLALLTGTLFTISGTSSTINITASNQTEIIGGGAVDLTVVPSNICELAGSDDGLINALQNFVNGLPGINCVFGFAAFSFSYGGVQTGFVWLGLIFGALGLALVYLAIGLFRGGK